MMSFLKYMSFGQIQDKLKIWKLFLFDIILCEEKQSFIPNVTDMSREKQKHIERNRKKQNERARFCPKTRGIRAKIERYDTIQKHTNLIEGRVD